MARAVKLGEFQAMQRGESEALGDADPFTVDPVADDRECTDQLKAIGAGSLNAQAEHEYDVEPDGSVRDWRQIATTRAEPSDEPERYEPTVHTITDDDDSDRSPSRLIPSDGSFLNERHKAAPELANLAEKLIDEHGFFEPLRGCRIDYKWRRKGTNANGKRAIGKLERVSGIWSAYVPYSFVIWLAADTARLANFTDRQVEAALFHQLAHIGQDSKGNWIRLGHDFEGFGSEVRHYGPWTEDLKIGSEAFTMAVQLGLDLDGDDDEEAEDDDESARMAHDDGAGVLIHADGTPLSADEIAEQVRAELADDPAEGIADLMHGAEPADYPTESDVTCDQCGGVVMLNSIEEDRRLASRVANGVEIEVLCDNCAAEAEAFDADQPAHSDASLTRCLQCGGHRRSTKTDAEPLCDGCEELKAESLAKAADHRSKIEPALPYVDEAPV